MSFAGQQWRSALVDIAYFAVVLTFGLKHIVSGEVLATILSAYAAYRFGAQMGKQQVAVALGGQQQGGSGAGGTPSGSGARPGEETGTSVPPVSRAHRQVLAEMAGVQL